MFAQKKKETERKKRWNARETEEETSRQDYEYGRRHINWTVARVLQAAAPAKSSVAGKVLVVFAQLSLDGGLGGLFARQPRRGLGRRELLVALVRAHLAGAAVAARDHEAGAEGARRLAGRGQLGGVAVHAREVQVVGAGPLQRRDALAVAAHRLCARGGRVGRGAVGHVPVRDVGAARGRQQVLLVVEAQRGQGAVGVGGAGAGAVVVVVCVVRRVRVERAVAEQRRGALVALLLQPLRAHGAKEAVGGERDMRSAGGRGRAAHADAASASSRWAGLRPPVLAARVRRRDGRGARRRQAGVACGARHAQHAAARGAALLVGGRHGHGVDVAGGAGLPTSSMTWDGGRSGAAGRSARGRGWRRRRRERATARE